MLIELFQPVLQLQPLRQRAPHAATRPHTHLRRIELPWPEQAENGLTVQERSFPGKRHGNRRHAAVRLDTLPVPAQRATRCELSQLDSRHANIFRLCGGHDSVARRRNFPPFVP